MIFLQVLWLKFKLLIRKGWKILLLLAVIGLLVGTCQSCSWSSIKKPFEASSIEDQEEEPLMQSYALCLRLLGSDSSAGANIRDCEPWRDEDLRARKLRKCIRSGYDAKACFREIYSLNIE